MKTHDLLPRPDADQVERYGFVMMDAETFIDQAPPVLVRRVARDAGRIDHVTIWEREVPPEEAWALTMPNAKELLEEWRHAWVFCMTTEAS
jgi:hypothetical protein